MKKLKISQLAPGFRYLQTLALKENDCLWTNFQIFTDFDGAQKKTKINAGEKK